MKRNFSYIAAVIALGVIVAPAPAHAAFGSGMVEFAIQELCKYMIGDLGGLLTAVAGFGAIVAAAFGAYRAFYSAIITAVGAYTISSILSIFFPQAAGTCNGAAQANRTANVAQAGNPAGKSALGGEDFFNFDIESVGETSRSAGSTVAGARAGLPEVQDKRSGWKGVDPFNEEQEGEADDTLASF